MFAFPVEFRMPRPRRIRRRPWLYAGLLLVLTVSPLLIVHTRTFRRFALDQIRIRVGNALGVVIDARDLDYNRFLSNYELKDVVVRSKGAGNLPAALTVRRVEIAISLWRLIRGSFSNATIRIDGLSAQWIAGADGRNNWPDLGGIGGKGDAGGPEVLVSSGEIRVEDARRSLFVHLPLKKLSASWESAGSKYAIAAESSAGSLRWGDSVAPVDALELRSAVANGGVSVESLHIISAASEAFVWGTLSGSMPRIDATADLSIAATAGPARGRIHARIIAAGLLSNLQLRSILNGDHVMIGSIAIDRPKSPPHSTRVPTNCGSSVSPLVYWGAAFVAMGSCESAPQKRAN